MKIKPSTTIRQDYNGFSKLCHELDEPVLLTRNGEADCSSDQNPLKLRL